MMHLLIIVSVFGFWGKALSRLASNSTSLWHPQGTTVINCPTMSVYVDFEEIFSLSCWALFSFFSFFPSRAGVRMRSQGAASNSVWSPTRASSWLSSCFWPPEYWDCNYMWLGPGLVSIPFLHGVFKDQNFKVADEVGVKRFLSLIRFISFFTNIFSYNIFWSCFSLFLHSHPCSPYLSTHPNYVLYLFSKYKQRNKKKRANKQKTSKIKIFKQSKQHKVHKNISFVLSNFS